MTKAGFKERFMDPISEKTGLRIEYYSKEWAKNPEYMLYEGEYGLYHFKDKVILLKWRNNFQHMAMVLAHELLHDKLDHKKLRSGNMVEMEAWTGTWLFNDKMGITVHKDNSDDYATASDYTDEYLGYCVHLGVEPGVPRMLKIHHAVQEVCELFQPDSTTFRSRVYLSPQGARAW